MRDRIRSFLESKAGTNVFLGAILVNAVAVGVNTYTAPGTVLDHALNTLDYVILAVFTVELLMRMVAAGSWRVWLKDPWNVMDFVIVAICYIPSVGSLAGLARTIRILRTLRAVVAFPDLRKIVAGLLKSLPGMTHVATLLLMLMYMYAVIGTAIFGDAAPQYFGTLHRSVLTLFQCVTLEGWNSIMEAVLPAYPYGWVFFVSYIFLATFILFNLFVGVIVSNLEEVTASSKEEEEDTELKQVLKEVRELRALVEKRNL